MLKDSDGDLLKQALRDAKGVFKVQPVTFNQYYGTPEKDMILIMVQKSQNTR